MVFTKIFNQTQVVIVSFLQSLEIVPRLFKGLLDDLLAILALPKGFRQLGHLFLKVEIRSLSKIKVAFEFLRLLN
jgi:hypothetical protein